MMTIRRFQVGVLLLLVILTLGNSETPKSSYTRTLLKVSRSLPSETEELRVRTNEGNIATLIVKKRNKPSLILNDLKNAANNTSQTESNITAENKNDSSLFKSSKLNNNKNEVKRLEESQIEQLRETFSKVPELKYEKLTNKKLVSEKDQGVNDDKIYYGDWEPINTKESEDLRHVQPKEEEYRNWKPLQTHLKTTITEERTNYDRFNEAGFSSGILLTRNFQDRTQRNLDFDDHDRKIDNPHYTFIPNQSRPSTRTNIGANLSKNRDGKTVPAEVIVRSEINVKAMPKRSAMSLDTDGTPIIHGTRVPDEPLDKIQTWRNARIINNKLISDGGSTATVETPVASYPSEKTDDRQRFEKFIEDVNRRYSRNYDDAGYNVYFEWDPRNYKNEALKADIYEPRSDHYRPSVHKRMLHPENYANYPISQRYIPDSQTIAPVVLKSGARAPVLQYAHPELGVQPAKILKNEKRRPDNFPENQHSFTEQRHKKKYVLNDKNIVDSYTTKNYYPNQHFYGLKRPNEQPFWVKISENLKNQFSNGVERVSQFTRPVIDPLVEATHKISQNLGLSKGKEAQDKIGTVASSSSILIPALGLVASGAALGIGAVAVGRYLDVDVLKRSNADEIDLEHKRALGAEDYLKTTGSEALGLNKELPETLYVLHDVPQDAKFSNKGANTPILENDGIFLVLEDKKLNAEGVENTRIKQTVDERDSVRANKQATRRKRSLDYLDIFKTETDMKNLIRNKRFQRKGADLISEIVEIDLPAKSHLDVMRFLVPKKRNKERDSNKNNILVVDDSSVKSASEISHQNTLEKIFEDFVDKTQDVVPLKADSEQEREDQEIDGTFFLLNGRSDYNFQSNLEKDIRNIEKIIKGSETVVNFPRESNGRQKRSIESDEKLEDALQNLENAEVAEIAHIEGDWTNTPCAKRIFCDTMIQRGPDALILMEKKMAELLRLIQPDAAVQVSGHFEEVMNTVRRRDCSSFSCPQARPGNVFF